MDWGLSWSSNSGVEVKKRERSSSLQSRCMKENEIAAEDDPAFLLIVCISN
jgi:hypothetical protein